MSTPDRLRPTASYSVLLIDGNIDTREMYSYYLDSAGIFVTLAATPREALDRATAAPPDLIVADVPLTAAGGIGMLIELQSLPRLRQVPVIMLSGWTDQRTPLLARAVGAAAFILKPCSPDQLLAAIYGVLEGGQVGGPSDLG